MAFSAPGLIALFVLSVVAVSVAGCGSSTETSADLRGGVDFSQDGLTVTPLDDEDLGDDSGLALPSSDSTDANGAESGEPVDTDAAAQPSIDNVAFTWWDGTPATGADLVGMPTVINFFASSCPPCVNELPDFESVSRQYQGQVRFVGIAAGDEREAAQQLLDETGVTFEIGDDPTNDMFVSMGGFVLPTTYFVDENGTVVYSQLGAMTAETLEAAITANFAATAS